MKAITNEITIRLATQGIDRQIYRVQIDGCPEKVAIMTTDTVTVLGKPRGNVKYRGQITTAISEFFLNATHDIMPNFLIATDKYFPANMLLGEYCQPIPVKWTARRDASGLKLATEVMLSENEYAPIAQEAILDCGYLTADELRLVRKLCFELLYRCEFLTAKDGLEITEVELEFGWDSRHELMLTGIAPSPVIEKSTEVLSAWIRRQAERRGIDTDEVELTGKIRSEAYYSYAEIYRQVFEFPFSPAKLPNNPLKALERYIEYHYE